METSLETFPIFEEIPDNKLSDWKWIADHLADHINKTRNWKENLEKEIREDLKDLDEHYFKYAKRGPKTFYAKLQGRKMLLQEILGKSP